MWNAPYDLFSQCGKYNLKLPIFGIYNVNFKVRRENGLKEAVACCHFGYKTFAYSLNT